MSWRESVSWRVRVGEWECESENECESESVSWRVRV